MRGPVPGMDSYGPSPYMGGFQAPMRSQPPPERPTLFLQKATPRNLGDLRSIRETENGSFLEISEKSEVFMFCADEEYLGGQKLLKADRLTVLMFLSDPHERDKNQEKAQQLQSLIDFIASDENITRIVVVHWPR